MIKAVLDVNILASAALNEEGLPALVVDLAIAGVYEMVVSDHIKERLHKVFERPYFLVHLSVAGRARILEAVNNDIESVEPDPSVRGIAPDEEDDLVLGTAVTAGADFLVTGDKGLLAIGHYGKMRIVTADEFLAEIEGL